MGLEAICLCRWTEGEGEVKALLESRDLILRGALRRTFPLVALEDVKAGIDDLSFRADGNRISLLLGGERAAKWAKKIVTPPPSLASKLGISPENKAWVIGAVDEAGLLDALDTNSTKIAKEAGLSLAVVLDQSMLDGVLRHYEGSGIAGPIWLIYPKGPGATFGEGAVRDHMRASGYIDTKVSAISDRLSATRYGLRKAPGKS